jgi:hypothetical protein
MKTNKLKTYLQSANINFLFGSGLSRPYLVTIGDIEKWLTKLSQSNFDAKVKSIIEASIYKEYFTNVILPNHTIINDDNYKSVVKNYADFLYIWNDIFNKRANKLLSKQINIYTTNIDMLVEKAVEQTKVEFNDGFKGSVTQIFNESNFQKSYSKTSLHFQNTFEIPVFNLIKMHGSINWAEKESAIINDCSLVQIKDINDTLPKIDSKFFIDCNEFETMKNNADKLISDKENSNISFETLYDEFCNEYKKLIIVNPTKQKFSETVMDIHFYELMRMYSNSLEKENSILFVMGFSFADEHIREITLRAANTNPTLLIAIFAFDDEQNFDFSNKANNSNIIVLTPSEFKEKNKLDEKDAEKKKIIDNITNFDLATINTVFSLINKEIPTNYGK